MDPTDPHATERYARAIVRWRWTVTIAALALVGAAATGMLRLRFMDEYRVFFSPDDPQLLRFDAVENIYAKSDNLFFVVEPPARHAFTAETLAIVERLTDEAWQIPFAVRVDSVTNFQHSIAIGDDLTVRNLVVDAATLDRHALAEIRETALAEPMLLNRLVPPDAGVLGLSVTLQLPPERVDDTARTAAVEQARKLVRQVEETHTGYRVHLTGVVMLNQAFQESTVRDMQTLTPLMYVVILLVMVALLRSVAATLSTLVVVVLSVTGALGLAGWAGLDLTPPSTAAVTIIMTLAVADSVHVLVTMLEQMRRGQDRRDAIVESLRINMQPVFLTSLTTVIGFLSMNFSEVPPLNDLGNISAVGVGIAWLLAITLLPAMMAILPVRVQASSGRRDTVMERLADLVIARRRRFLWGTGAVALLLTAALPLNALNDQFVDYFDVSTAFRQDSDFAEERLSGLYQIDFSLGAGESGGISEPAYLATVDDFAAWYRGQPGVVHVASISDVFRRVNRNMHGDDASFYRLPADRERAAQYLLLYEMSLPYGLDLNNQVNVDKSATRLSVTVRNLTSRQLVELVEAGEGWLRDNAPAHMATQGVGPGVMFSYISARNIRSMLWGTLLAVALIAGTLMLALRSVRYGLVSFVANLLPAAMAFGLWGLLVGEINLGLSIVSGMCLGIVVDDTVHFLSKYLRARRERQVGPEAAVKYAFASVGTALVVTSAVLIAGFLVLAQSTFGFNGGMGRLSAIIIACALGADLLLLPPLLIHLDRREPTRATPHHTEDRHELVAAH